MATVRIMLAPLSLMTAVYFGPETEKLAAVKQYFNHYTVLPHMWVKGYKEEAAEEVFDLTNNPSRQEERLDKYGNGRSLSVGDIVLVDNVMYLCLSNGWQVFTE